MKTTIKKTIILIVVLIIVACGKSDPMDAPAEQIAQVTLKTNYANPTDLAKLEEQARNEWNMDAKKLIKVCSIAALQYMKMTPAQAGKIAAQMANPAGGDDTARDLAAGFGNHLTRCLTKPSAYDVSKS